MKRNHPRRSTFFDSAYFVQERDKMASASYEHFMQTGEAKLLPPVVLPLKQLPYKQGSSQHIVSSPDINVSLAHGGCHMGIDAAVKAVPRVGKYLLPSLAGVTAAHNSHERINAAISQGCNPAAASVCGTLGAAVETGASFFGGHAVIGGTLAMISGSGMAGVAAAVPLVTAGFTVVGEGSHILGNAAEQGCHIVYDTLRQF